MWTGGQFDERGIAEWEVCEYGDRGSEPDGGGGVVCGCELDYKYFYDITLCDRDWDGNCWGKPPESSSFHSRGLNGDTAALLPWSDACFVFDSYMSNAVCPESR